MVHAVFSKAEHCIKVVLLQSACQMYEIPGAHQPSQWEPLPGRNPVWSGVEDISWFILAGQQICSPAIIQFGVGYGETQTLHYSIGSLQRNRFVI